MASGSTIGVPMRSLGDWCWEAGVLRVLLVLWVMCLHVVVDKFAYPLCVFVYLAVGVVVVFGILHHAFEVALDLGDAVVLAIVDLVLDDVDR